MAIPEDLCHIVWPCCLMMDVWRERQIEGYRNQVWLLVLSLQYLACMRQTDHLMCEVSAPFFSMALPGVFCIQPQGHYSENQCYQIGIF